MVVVWSYIRLENNPNMTIPANVIIIQFLVVAISEEIILRGVIMDELDKIFQNKYASCIVNAAILHLFIIRVKHFRRTYVSGFHWG